jgi:Zn ribbon nucleic-acid-binding protein
MHEILGPRGSFETPNSHLHMRCTTGTPQSRFEIDDISATTFEIMAQPQEDTTLIDRLVDWAEKRVPEPLREGVERYKHKDMDKDLREHVEKHLGTV